MFRGLGCRVEGVGLRFPSDSLREATSKEHTLNSEGLLTMIRGRRWASGHSCLASPY